MKKVTNKIEIEVDGVIENLPKVNTKQIEKELRNKLLDVLSTNAVSIVSDISSETNFKSNTIKVKIKTK